jgi:chloramphenicol O-acetyltransferase
MTQNIKNFIEEGEKELLEKFKYLNIEVPENCPKLDVVSLCNRIKEDRKEFAISLIKMIVEDFIEKYKEAEKEIGETRETSFILGRLIKLSELTDGK